MLRFPLTPRCALRAICLVAVLTLGACGAHHNPFGPPQVITNEDGPL